MISFLPCPRKTVPTPSAKTMATVVFPVGHLSGTTPNRASSHHTGGFVIAKMTAIVAALTLATIVCTAHARTLTSRQAVTVRLRSALPVRTTFGRDKTLHSTFDDVGKGLVNLSGDRLSLNGQATKASASWSPDTSWYASQERTLPVLFPECKAPDIADCGSWYSEKTTSAVQAALWVSQNPANCNSARYLVLSEPWPSGLGSLLHIHMYMLAVAVRDNRILIPSPELTWDFAAPELCSQFANKMSPPHRYLDCYFLPTTLCSLPPDWSDAARPITMMDMPDTVVTTPSRSGFPFWNVSHNDMVIQSADPVLSAHKDKPSHWWYAQLTKFILRPSDFTLRQLVWPLQLGAFYRTHGVQPHPLAAVFIRAGDKFIEAPLLSVDAHFAELAPIAAKLGIKDVYLGSDSHDRIVEALDKYGSTYTIHFIDWARPGAGLAFADVRGSQMSWRMSELVRLALADMYISAQADVVVGTLSSNWARLADEFRRANGKVRIPQLNPEMPAVSITV